MNILRRIVSSIDKDPIILSHHPLCGRFDDHVFQIGGHYVCIGCTTVYPSALATGIFLVLSDLNSFALTILLALSSFGVNLLRFKIKNHRLSILLNASLGISLGASFFSAAYAPEDLRPFVILAGLAVVVLFSYVKGHRVFVTCKACERYPEFPSCCNSRAQNPIEILQSESD